MTSHIALVTSSYPDDTPGTEAAGSFVEDFARAMARRVRVTVVAASTSTSDQTQDNLRVRRFAVPRLPLSLLRPLWPGDWLALFRTLRNGRSALETLIADDRPDHIFALWALPGGYWTDRGSRGTGVPFSVWSLGSDIWSLGKLPVVRGILGNILRRANHCYADGLELAADVERLSGARCDFLPSTRSLQRPHDRQLASNGPYNLAFLGRWHENKGVDLMLESLSQLTDEDWRQITAVRIAGGGPLADQVRAAADELQRNGRDVDVGDYLDKGAATELIAWADYLMLPSRIESIPVIFSDAMQIGTPIIATPVGDLPRLYKNYNFGHMADAVSAHAFSLSIRHALNDSAAKFGPELTRASADFNLEKIVDDFLRDARESSL